MFGSSILDVAIGVSFIYLLLSLVCTAVNEAFASFVQKRGANLFEGIKNLLNDPQFTGLAQQLYNHGLIDGISESGADPKKATRKPSYIPAAHFSLALVDILGARGVVAAAHGDLLTVAEKADDAYRTALNATPNDAAATQAAKAQSDSATLALTTAAQQAATARDAAAQQAAGAPGNANLATAAALAKDAADAADAAVKMLEARRAAVDLAGDKENAALIGKASDTLEQALAAARTLAAKCPDPLGNLQSAIDRLPPGHSKESLRVLVDKTRRDAALVEQRLQIGAQHVEMFQKNVETWFNDSMDRVGGWYKRWTQRVLYVIAVIVVIAANADTVKVVRHLYSDGALRSGLVASAEAAVKNPPLPSGTDASATASAQGVSQLLSEKAAGIQLPLGWNDLGSDWRSVHTAVSEVQWAFLLLLFYKILGLTISTFAVALGAPFWFDTLSKVVNLRGAGTPPGETKKGAPTGTSSSGVKS